MNRKLFILASALWLATAAMLGAASGCHTAAGTARAPAVPRTQESGDVSVTPADLGRARVSILTPGELYRMRGGGIDVTCLEDRSTFLGVTPRVRLPLESAKQMRLAERVLELALAGSALVGKPLPPWERAVVDELEQIKMITLPFSCLPDRVAQALATASPERERSAAIARALLNAAPVRLTGQFRTPAGPEAWQIDLRLTEGGRRKLETALAAPATRQAATGPSTRRSDDTVGREKT